VKNLPPSLNTVFGVTIEMTAGQLKKRLRPFFRKSGVDKAVLFGSFARGTASKRSDVDILIVQETNKRFLDRFSDFSWLYDLLKEYAVDLLIYSPEELKRNASRPFIKSILTEGVVLYER
jgi:predicted nucleotidyltransferase